MIGDRLAGVSSQRVRDFGAAREPDHAGHELIDIARLAEHRPLIRDADVRAGESAGRNAGDSTSPICSRSLATIPPAIAMYSKTLVGDPKNLLSTMWLLCGET